MNTFNKLVSLVSAGSLLLASSCSKKIDEAFANPNAQVKQPIETLLPGIIANMAIQHSANGTLYGPQNDGRYVGQFIQFWNASGTGNQYDRMADNFANKSDILGSVWAMHYYGSGMNIVRTIEWGTEEKKWDFVGVAQAIQAWSWLTTTDMHDDIILREAHRPNQLVFKYDPQPDVYEHVKVLCKAALENLDKTGDGVNPASLAMADAYGNGGDKEKWKKFVYGILARTYHRTTNKASYKPDSVVYYCDLAMQTNAENTMLSWSNAGLPGTFSFFATRRLGPGATDNTATLSHRQTRFIANLMSGLNGRFSTNTVDPRAWYIIRENANGTFKGTRPNKGTDGLVAADQPLTWWGAPFTNTSSVANDNNSRYVFVNNAKWPIMTASEIQFIKAEALLRQGERPTAQIAYRKGIELNFDLLRTHYETNIPPANRITDVSRDNYLNNPINVPAFADLTLSHIMMQKYVSMYVWGMLETWVDMRRYHYTDLDPQSGEQVYAEFAPPSGTDLWPANGNKLIYRVRPRYNSEYLYNIDELNRLGAFAPDYITKECWFSKP
jgi:hypothetical protein